MPRVIKHPDVRRSEILDCAQSLFLTRGYDAASLNDVIAEAGLSKGAFYHYFASKEELLEALADRFARQVFAAVQDVFVDPALDPLARLNAFLEKSWRFKLDAAPANWLLFEALYRPENQFLYQRITTASAAYFLPALTDLITQGVQSGLFQTFDPEGVAELFLNLPATTRPILAQAIAATRKKAMDDAIATVEKRLRLHGIAIDRLLGLPDGSVHLANPGYLRTIMKARPRGRR